MEEGGDRDAFWRSALLKSFADECVCHIIVPTIMTTRMATWEETRNTMSTSEVAVVRAQRYNSKCCYCNTQLSGKTAKIAVRFLLGKRPATRLGDNAPGFVYRAAYGSAAICELCCLEKRLAAHLDANTDMGEAMFDRLETISQHVGMACMTRDVSGVEFLSLVFHQFYEDYTSFKVHIGAMDASCAGCNVVKDPPKRCTGCRYARYCNAKCSAAHWPIHKTWCKLLAQNSFFYTQDMK